jgi:hypothetical protein
VDSDPYRGDSDSERVTMGLRIKVWDDPSQPDDTYILDQLMVLTSMSLDQLRTVIQQVNAMCHQRDR